MNSLKTFDLHISMISDIIFDPYFIPLLKAHFGENIIIYPIPYGEQNDEEYRRQIEKSNIVILWLNLESSYLHACDALCLQPMSDQQIVEEVAASCKKLYADVSTYSNAHILWFLFEDYFNKLPIVAGYQYNAFVDKLNADMSSTLKNNVSLIDLSDEMTQTTARLNMMNDGLQTTQELQDKLYLSAQRSRASYSDTADMVAKLGMQAKNAFSSNDELIAFSEQLNKTFKIAGTDASGVQSTMYNLTQALASGVLRGQDLNSVMSNAQPILQNVADYLGVSVDKIRGMAADGELSASVVKNAMLAAAEETNAAFEDIPKTFGDMATSMKNQALIEFQPILTKLNEIANSPGFQTMVDNVTNAFAFIAGIATEIVDMIAKAVNALAPYMSAISDWAKDIYENIVNNWAGIALLLQMVAGGLAAIAAAILLYKVVTGLASAAQWLFNSALWACPLTWIVVGIMIIIGALYAIVAWINKTQDKTISATGIIMGVIYTLGAYIYNEFIVPIRNQIVAFINFFANVFNDPVASIKILFFDLAEVVLNKIAVMARGIETLLNKIPGIDLEITSGIEGVLSTIESASAKVKSESEWKQVVNTIDVWEYEDAWNSGYAMGENIDDKIANFDPTSLLGSNTPDENKYGEYDWDGMGSSLENIDANTKGQLDYSEEELKLWRDIAERDTVNRFTTAEVSVQFGSINNNVSSDVDLDGIADYIGERVEEALYEVAEGVHK